MYDNIPLQFFICFLNLGIIYIEVKAYLSIEMFMLMLKSDLPNISL